MIYRRKSYYLILMIVGIAGIILGTIVAKKTAVNPRSVLHTVDQIKNLYVEPKDIVWECFKDSVFLLLTIFIMGFYGFGVFPIMIVLCFKGYFIGFSCGCILNHFTLRTIIMSVVGILLPSLIVLSIMCSIFCSLNDWVFMKRKEKNKLLQLMIKNGLLYLTGVVIQSMIQYFAFLKI